MAIPIVLASTSEIRAQLLRNACVPFEAKPARVDESSVKSALMAEGASARDVADALADLKAAKLARKAETGLVLGCDQVLEFHGTLLSKPQTQSQAVEQILSMSGHEHTLFSAAVIYEDAQPVWRHVGSVTLKMRNNSSDYVTDYVERNWDSIRHAVGAYKLEEEGVRLFSSIQGDYFTVLGMPLLEILDYLTIKGFLQK